MNSEVHRGNARHTYYRKLCPSPIKGSPDGRVCSSVVSSFTVRLLSECNRQFTVRLIGAVCVTVPLLPVMVSAYVPREAAGFAEIVSVEVPLAVAGLFVYPATPFVAALGS